jgi:hypothetical protein
MSHKKKQERRAIANIVGRPSAASSAIEVVGDPVGVGLGRSIKIDMGKLPTPQNVYDADYAWIEHHPGNASLFFAKRNSGEEGTLRTRLEVRYPVENLVGHFWRNSREFHQKMKEFSDLWPADPERLGVSPSSMKTLKEHSEWANFETMAHAGTEAVVDFFSLPPLGLARFAKGQGSEGLVLIPVVRVQTTVFELTRLLDTAGAVVQEIESYLPERLMEELAKARGDRI